MRQLALRLLVIGVVLGCPSSAAAKPVEVIVKVDASCTVSLSSANPHNPSKGTRDIVVFSITNECTNARIGICPMTTNTTAPALAPFEECKGDPALAKVVQPFDTYGAATGAPKHFSLSCHVDWDYEKAKFCFEVLATTDTSVGCPKPSGCRSGLRASEILLEPVP